MDREIEKTRHLVQEARAGRAGAWTELLQAHEGTLRRRLERHFPSTLRPVVDPSDVIQDTLIDAVRGFDRFEYRGPGSLRAWLERVLDNRLQMVIRHRARASQSPQPPETLHASGISSPGTSPAAASSREERRRRLLEKVDDMPADYREVIRRIKLEGQSVSQAASAMGRSENAVKKLLARALLRLATDLRGLSGTDPP